MSLFDKAGRLGAAAILLAASGAALAGPGLARTDDGPLRCELDVTRKSGSVELTALAHSVRQTDGLYELRVSGRGTDIRQGGPFTASPKRPAELGRVALGASGPGYEAELEIRADGRSVSCARRIGGGI